MISGGCAVTLASRVKLILSFSERAGTLWNQESSFESRFMVSFERVRANDGDLDSVRNHCS